MRPEELEKMPLQVEKLFYELQNRVLEDVVRRIRKTGEITSTADYQIEKIVMMGQTSEFIETELKRLTGKTNAEIWQLYEDVVDKEYTRNKSIYEQVNSNFIPYEDNPIMKAWVSSIVAQTQGEIKNITKSMGFSLKMRNQTVFTPFSEYYQKYLDRACIDIVTGTFSYDTVLKRVVKEMTASGIRSVDYASGYGNRVTVAARRAVMTGVHQLSSQINQMNAEKLETETYEVTWHSGARPSHWWGGMVFDMKELEDVCGLGKVDGLCGANCYHSYYAFIPGISVRTYTDEQLAEMNAKEKIEREWQGKKYNAYDASQKQRQMETLMRKQRSDVKLLKSGKASQEEILAAQSRYLHTLHQYQGFSKKMNLPEQMQRVYMDGLGRIAPVEKIRVLKDAHFNVLDKFVEKNSTKINLKTYSDLPRSLRSSFENGLQGSHKLVADALQKVYKDAKYYTANGKTAEYIQGLKYVGVKEKKPSGSMAHELMHYLDDMYKLSSRKNMLEGFMLDAEKSGILANPIKYIKDNYPEVQFKTFANGKEYIVGNDGLSDIIDALTNGEKNLGTWHGEEYWKTKGANRKEIFAQCGKIYYNNDEMTMKMFQEIFPKGTFRFEKIMEGLK